MAGDQRADDCAKAVQHPVAGAGRDALAVPARDEIDDEDHVRHQGHRVEAVLDQQGADSGRSMVVLRVMRSRRIGLRLSRPAPPAR
jgi:hypothetical protein